ncbi:Protein NLRC3 [Durusdinium trenchii]|uniref:Protein NLRC3 n=2 Tax=Durusdinium trenchii TaxID=1381693 RepID=A0ABP0NU90_9DINO
MGAVLRICPSRQPASRARVASRINEPRSPSAVMRQVLFEDEDSQAIVVPSGDESTEAERSGSSSQSRQVDADSKVKKARRRRGEVLEDMDAWHCAQSIGEAAGCLSSASASVTKLALRGVPLTDEE